MIPRSVLFYSEKFRRQAGRQAGRGSKGDFRVFLFIPEKTVGAINTLLGVLERVDFSSFPLFSRKMSRTSPDPINQLVL